MKYREYECGGKSGGCREPKVILLFSTWSCLRTRVAYVYIRTMFHLVPCVAVLTRILHEANFRKKHHSLVCAACVSKIDETFELFTRKSLKEYLMRIFGVYAHI